jgi:hypothetical protein
MSLLIPKFAKSKPQTLANFGIGTLEHDPEKWIPVFRKDHAPPKIQSAMTIQPKAIAFWRSPEKWVPVFRIVLQSRIHGAASVVCAAARVLQRPQHRVQIE